MSHEERTMTICGEQGKRATPHLELIAQLLASGMPKNEREHAAAREIVALREIVTLLLPLAKGYVYSDGREKIQSNREIIDGANAAICKHESVSMGFGLAGGGYGAYEYCEDCAMILHKTQEPTEQIP